MKSDNNEKIRKNCHTFLKRNKFSIVNLRTGFGKSKIIFDFVESYSNKKIIILVPKSIIEQWQRYFVKTKNSVKVISQHSAAKHRDEIAAADFIIVDEPKLLKSKTKFWQLWQEIDKSADKVILLDATLIENNVNDETDCLRAAFGGMSMESFLKTIFHRKVEMPRKVKHLIYRIALSDERKRSLMYGEYLLLQALRKKNKFMIYKYLMENIRILSSTADSRDLGWLKIRALKDIIELPCASHGIIFASQLSTVCACVAELQRLGKRVKAITGQTRKNERLEIADEFNRGNLDYIVGTRAVERGLDLGRGILVLNVDTPFSGSGVLQRDRVTRMNAYGFKTTTFITMVLDDTVEDKLREIVKAKIKTDKNLKKGLVQQVSTQRWTDFMEKLIERRRKLLCLNKKR